MNERIQQLVETSYIHDKQNDSSFFNKEKFAELLLRNVWMLPSITHLTQKNANIHG